MANEDKSARYHRLCRRASLLGTLWQFGCLLLVLVSGASTGLERAVANAVGPSPSLVAAGYIFALGLVYGLVALPLAFYRGVVLERRYGLSTEPAARWVADTVKGGSIVLAGLVGAGLLVLLLRRLSPEWWWASSAAAFGLLLVLLAAGAPLALMPIFCRVTPLGNEALRARLLGLAERAGTPVLDAVEWHVSSRTRKANAALAGIGRTRRILISDTLLEAHSDEEIEAVLAHELAHHVHGDIWSALALDVVRLGVGFYVADVALRWFTAPLGLSGSPAIAGLPLVGLAVGGVWLVLRPAANALSRAHERRADRFALDVTNNAAAFISALRRLGARNMAEERPSRLVQMLYATHPSTVDRVEAAKGWSPRRTRRLEPTARAR
jgi:STE24 endopeptidase